MIIIDNAGLRLKWPARSEMRSDTSSINIILYIIAIPYINTLGKRLLANLIIFGNIDL